MDSNCANCDLLRNQCLELKSEINLLNVKLNKLLGFFCNDHHEVACQTDAINSKNHEVECQTSIINCQDANCQIGQTLGYTHVGCQTKDITRNSSYSQTAAVSHSNSGTLSVSNSFTEETDLQIPTSVTQLNDQHLVNHQLPCIVSHTSLPDQPFESFEINKLDLDIVYDKKLNSRSICYFGDYSYSYGDVTHEARPIPQSGNYLSKILDHVHIVLPSFSYNSVLVTKYCDGSEYLNYHSDNEHEIVPDSNIMTISLGATRVCKFRKLPVCSTNPEHSVFVRHGDAVLMSRKSQDSFQHSIVADDCKYKRVSITLRLLRPKIQPISVNPDVLDTTPQSRSENPDVVNTAPQTDTKYTIYIGDSMFHHLDRIKLTSSSQKAIVLSYPGATAGGILNRLHNDPVFNQIDSRKVEKIIVFGGTNNVDRILNIPSNLKSSFISGFDHISENILNQTKTEISELINYLHIWSNAASINIVNILPRLSLNRNIVINALNHHIKNLSMSNNHVTTISTELDRSLFSSKSEHRKNQYFTSNGTDNVHLNTMGLVRLARHLKYFVHNF